MSTMSTKRVRKGLMAVLIALASIATTAPAPPVPASGAAGPLRIASWNIRWLAARDVAGAVPRRASDYDRLRRYAERLDADVVALQEVEGVAAARRVFDPERYAFLFAAGGGSVQRAGFAWKKSLRVTPHADFAAIGLDGRSRSGADLTVHGPGGDLRLLSIHLKSGCASGRLDGPDVACGLLREQARRLEDWVDARAREQVPFAVLGDFNRRFTPKDPFWIGLDDAEPPEADLIDAGFGRRPPCWGGRYRQYIDHIVLSRTAGTWLVPNSFAQLVYDAADAGSEEVLSDHCPIVLVLDPARAVDPSRPGRGGPSGGGRSSSPGHR